MTRITSTSARLARSPRRRPAGRLRQHRVSRRRLRRRRRHDAGARRRLRRRAAAQGRARDHRPRQACDPPLRRRAPLHRRVLRADDERQFTCATVARMRSGDPADVESTQRGFVLPARPRLANRTVTIAPMTPALPLGRARRVTGCASDHRPGERRERAVAHLAGGQHGLAVQRPRRRRRSWRGSGTARGARSGGARRRRALRLLAGQLGAQRQRGGVELAHAGRLALARQLRALERARVLRVRHLLPERRERRELAPAALARRRWRSRRRCGR